MPQTDDLTRWEWLILTVAATVATFGWAAIYLGLFWAILRIAAALRPPPRLTYRQRRRLGLVRPKRASDALPGHQGVTKVDLSGREGDQ